MYVYCTTKIYIVNQKKKTNIIQNNIDNPQNEKKYSWFCHLRS